MQPQLPTMLAGRYMLERSLGQGGMGTVYLARDEKHRRPVAVKVLHPDLVRTIAAERFVREIGIVAQLTHPHILALHDSGESDGLLWFAMPYVEGESLRALLERERQLPLADALRIAGEVASALDHAHRHDILHRDIKPENILLVDGRAVVADFGIARAIRSAGDERITETGITLGTAAYMSPEQCTADQSLDGRSDLYSLGCVLYEMLAGIVPFTGPTAQAVIAMRLLRPPVPLRHLRPSVPESLEAVVARAMAPVPADRFRSGEEFRAALALIAAELATSPRPVAPEVPAPRRGRRTLARAAAAGGAIAVLGAGWLAVGTFRPRSATPADPPSRILAVLPLADSGGGDDKGYLAEGLTDAVIRDLARIPSIRVISWTSVQRYGAGAAMSSGGMDRPMEKPGMAMAGGSGGRAPVAIGKELGADLVLQGTMRRAGDSIRVFATLLEVATGAPVAVLDVTRSAHQLFELQQELVADLASASAPRPVPREAGAPRPSRNPAAHEAYLKGVYFQAHWKLPEAIASLERAVDLDSTYAEAHAAKARAYYFLAFFGRIAPAVALGEMQRAARTALALDSTLAEGHAQMALVRMLGEWNWPAAEAEFRRALELSPGNAQIHHDYAHYLLARGRQQESLRESEVATRLDPANPMLISCLGWHSLFGRRDDMAIAYATEAHRMMPDFWDRVIYAWALMGQGKPDSAVVALREAARLAPGGFTSAALGHGLAVAGHTAEARRVLAGLLYRAEQEYVSAYDIATVYAGLGESENAFRWLRRAADERSTFVVQVAWDARFSRLRAQPQYRELVVSRLGLSLPTQ